MIHNWWYSTTVQLRYFFIVKTKWHFYRIWDWAILTSRQLKSTLMMYRLAIESEWECRELLLEMMEFLCSFLARCSCCSIAKSEEKSAHAQKSRSISEERKCPSILSLHAFTFCLQHPTPLMKHFLSLNEKLNNCCQFSKRVLKNTKRE